jgi:methyltransferase (TIGR00027 family)
VNERLAGPAQDTFDAVERTALLTAALRAADSSRPDRLYDDPFARLLSGEIGAKLLAEVRAVTFPQDGSRTVPSTPDYNAIRTRFFDGLLLDATRPPGPHQVVLAPAGMDSRAYRLPWGDGVRFFEIDRPAVLGYKRARLAGRSPRAQYHRSVAADLAADDWESRLQQAGYDPGSPSTWLVEGLLYYLEEKRVRQILDRIADIAAPGSRIAADMVNRAALTSPDARSLLDVFAGWGCPWLFGHDEPERLFADHGFDVRAVQPGEPEADFGRWPDPVAPREQTAVRRVFFVHGRRR